MLYTALLALAGVAAAAPAAPAAPRSDIRGCSDRAQGDFSWFIQNFQYNGSWTFSTPAHQNAYGSVRFTVTNPSLSAAEDVVCQATSSQLQDFFYGNQAYACQPVVGDSSVTTSFSFDATGAHPLVLNQSWACSDADPAHPTTYHYAGRANLTLACADAAWQNPDWQLGEIYSTKTHLCTASDFSITPYELSAVA